MCRLHALIHPIQLTQNHQVPFTCCLLSYCCALVHVVPLAWHLPFPPSPAVNLANCILSDPAQVLPFCHADSDFYFLKATCLFPYELHACVCARSLQSSLALCNPVYYSLPNSSVHGILQARILGWVAMPSSRDLPDPGDRIPISCIGRQILYHQGHLRSPTVSHPVTIQLRTELLQPIPFLDT